MKPRIVLLCSVMIATLCIAPAYVFAGPLTFSQANVPDFSQHELAAWSNYCAPTAGTNVAYFFAQTYAGLRQGHPLAPQGQGALADVGASTNIGGNVPPPAPLIPSNMANLMGTTAAGGTTLAGASVGLDAYLEVHDGQAGNLFWNTSILLSNPIFGGVGGPAFWNTLQNQLSGGSGILLAMHWQGGIAPGGYETPDPYNPSDFDEDTGIGHAVTMVGYDVSLAIPTLDIHDPANNPPGMAGTKTHVWPPVAADTYGVTVNATDLTIVVGPATGVIYGAVITNPVPEPATLGLLASGLLALAGLALWQRRRSA